MPAISRATLKKQIAAGDTGPLYLLIGDDDGEKSAAAAEFAEMVDEGLRAFSVDRLYGGEIKADDLFEAAATLPMMAPRRIVTVFDAERWVRERAERDKVPLDTAAVRALVERAGNNIVHLRGGLERLALYAMGQPKITADDVRQVVPVAGEATNFGIADAIGRNDAAEALRELTLALEGGAQPFFVLGQLRWVAEKMPRARLKVAIEAVFRTDEAIKSSGGDPKILLERLVVELCEPQGRLRAAPSYRRS